MLMHCAQLRRTFSGKTAPALTLDSAKSVAFIERHGECDLPTRRHAEESRPAPMQGRTMSLILAPSAEELMQPGLTGTDRAAGDPRSDASLSPGLCSRAVAIPPRSVPVRPGCISSSAEGARISDMVHPCIGA